MSGSAASSVTRICYFNPLTQTIQPSRKNDEPTVYIHLTVPAELSAARQNEVIQRLGNYMALTAARWGSLDAMQLHDSSLVLQQEEIDECWKLEKSLDPVHLSNEGIHFRLWGVNVPRGDINLMRGMLGRVRDVFKASSALPVT